MGLPIWREPSESRLEAAPKPDPTAHARSRIRRSRTRPVPRRQYEISHNHVDLLSRASAFQPYDFSSLEDSLRNGRTQSFPLPDHGLSYTPDMPHDSSRPISTTTSHPPNDPYPHFRRIPTPPAPRYGLEPFRREPSTSARPQSRRGPLRTEAYPSSFPMDPTEHRPGDRIAREAQLFRDRVDRRLRHARDAVRYPSNDLSTFPPLRRYGRRSVNDQTRELAIDGLASHRERSWSPAAAPETDAGVDHWERMLTTITPDPRLPSTDVSFASAVASGSTTDMTRDSLRITPPSSVEDDPNQVCDDSDSDESRYDEGNGSNIPPSAPSPPRVVDNSRTASSNLLAHDDVPPRFTMADVEAVDAAVSRARNEPLDDPQFAREIYAIADHAIARYRDARRAREANNAEDGSISPEPQITMFGYHRSPSPNTYAEASTRARELAANLETQGSSYPSSLPRVSQQRRFEIATPWFNFLSPPAATAEIGLFGIRTSPRDPHPTRDVERSSTVAADSAASVNAGSTNHATDADSPSVPTVRSTDARYTPSWYFPTTYLPSPRISPTGTTTTTPTPDAAAPAPTVPSSATRSSAAPPTSAAPSRIAGSAPVENTAQLRRAFLHHAQQYERRHMPGVHDEDAARELEAMRSVVQRLVAQGALEEAWLHEIHVEEPVETAS